MNLKCRYRCQNLHLLSSEQTTGQREILSKQREEPVQAVMSEHMSVHASLVMMRSVKLNLESIDMIKLSLIWQAHSSPSGTFPPVSASLSICSAALHWLKYDKYGTVRLFFLSKSQLTLKKSQYFKYYLVVNLNLRKPFPVIRHSYVEALTGWQ